MHIVFHQRWSSRRATGPISTNKVSSLTHLWVALGTVRSEFFYLSLAIADYIVVVAGRTLLQSIITSLERITFDGDPLQFLVESTTYQPFISLFAQTEMAKSDPTLKGIRACDHRIVYISSFNRRLVANFASALAIELRRGSLPDNRDFVRFKFKNGTDDDFRTVHVFGHKADIPLTEFIYRVEVLVYLHVGVMRRLRPQYFRRTLRSVPTPSG